MDIPRRAPTFKVTGTGNRSCYVEIGDVTIYLDHSIEGQPILVDAWTSDGGDHPKRVKVIGDISKHDDPDRDSAT